MKRPVWRVVPGLLVLGLLITRPAAHAGEQPGLRRHEFEEAHMGTIVRIVLYASDASAAAAASRAAFRRIAELDSRLSDYKPDSELNRAVREAASGPVPVGADLFAVLSAAQTLAARTAGAFDVTAGALTRVWRRARRVNQLPTDEEIEAARAAGGHEHLVLDAASRTLRLLRPGMRLDLGGIAKGYAADAALAALRGSGCPRALVAVGGDIAAGDAPPRTAGWEVRLASLDERPATVVLSRSAVSTSGDTEQWLEAGGVRYSHIIDPRTGRALSGARLVSVIAARAMTSDMLATAASILGVPEAIRLIEDTPGAAALVATRARTGGVQRTPSSRWPGE